MDNVFRGQYFQRGMQDWSDILDGDYYVDKTGLIRFVNQRIEKKNAMLCVTRPRRFGKTFAASMLAAYYDRSCDSSALFQNLEIAQDPSFRTHLNQYHVLTFSVTDFASSVKTHRWYRDLVSGEMRKATEDEFVYYVENTLRRELLSVYPNANPDNTGLADTIFNIYRETGKRFVVIIDEWDTVFREFSKNSNLQFEWILFLRGLFKSGVTSAIAAAYMTGILPIKRYGTHTALTNFKEYTMLMPQPLEAYFGFLEGEVRKLLEGTQLNFDDIRNWYDGYNVGDVHVYNPVSVINAIERNKVSNYWNKTETFEALRIYIDLNFEGLHEDLIQMYWGGRVPINPDSFQNDLTSIESKSDVFTLLVHLGYLTYDEDTETVYIPNRELKAQFWRALNGSHLKQTIERIRKSQTLLDAIWNQQEELVAQLMEEFHDSVAVPLKYNNEDCLRSALRMALLTSADTYTCLEELPSGKGYADMLFLPLPGKEKPALLVELKWNHTVESAIEQILSMNYPQVLSNYSGEILLIGITYRETSKRKEHICSIRTFTKP